MLCSKSRLTSKRYSTLYSTPSLTEVKHTRSSYSGRDDRLAFLPTCIICGFAGLCKGCRGIHGNFTGDPGGALLCRMTARRVWCGADQGGSVGRLHKWSAGKRGDESRRSIFRLHLYYTNFFGESIFVRRGKVGIVWVRRKFKNKNEIYFFPLSSEMFTFCAFSQISSMCL